MKNLGMILFICFISAASFTDNALGDTFCVAPDGVGTANLQTALTTAQSNGSDDTIQIVRGTYNGNFYFSSSEGNNLTLEGGYAAGCSSREVNPATTILDGGDTDVVLLIESANGGDIHVDGVTTQNGNAVGISGGGMYIYTSSDADTAGKILLTNNIVKNNKSLQYQAGGVSAESFSNTGHVNTVTLINNIITDNTTTGEGGGVQVASYSNTFPGETVTLLNNTIAGNTAGTTGGGLQMNADNNTIRIVNNIIWGNAATSSGDDIFLNGFSYTANGYNNDYAVLSGSWSSESDNINLEPKLTGNYRLRPGSPCIDTGTSTDPDLPNKDFEGDDRIIDGDQDGTALVDIGADEYLRKTMPFIFMLLQE